MDDVRNAGEDLICMSAGMRKKHQGLKRFLRGNLYNHYRVNRMTHKARQVVRALFEAFTADHELLPDDARRKIAAGGDTAERIIADYIAGMTDRYAIAEYDRIKDPRANSFF
jgi:dGTPase